MLTAPEPTSVVHGVIGTALPVSGVGPARLSHGSYGDRTNAGLRREPARRGERVIEGIVDLHVHGGPSLVPRHALDTDTVEAQRATGVEISVLKAHEGSTVERAALCGPGVYGGIVCNSPVGGANEDAVDVALRLGGRVVWMPTMSSPDHLAAFDSPELSVHRHITLRPVEVVTDGRVRDEWLPIFDLIAEHDAVLASGHVNVRDAVRVFREAHRRGVRRFLLNHPQLPFLGWSDSYAEELRALDVRMELGILPDLAVPEGARTSVALSAAYARELCVFGADLGHADYPVLQDALPGWLADLESTMSEEGAHAVVTDNGRELLMP